MHPDLFTIPLPEFLQNLFNTATLTVHTYGVCIAMGILASFLYASHQAKKQLGISTETMSDLLLFLILASVVGGKIFFYFEDVKYYFGTPANMIKSFSGGFVFYGSLLFAIPTMIIFFKKKKMPVLPMLDIIAITATIVHAFGRCGCFNAGCCHGVPTDSWIGVTFSNPSCAANPKDVPLHPTQLYSIFMLLVIMGVLFLIKNRKKFDGQMFLIYMFLYAIGRSIIEIFRGDSARGFIIDNVLSHSQFISIFVLIGVGYFYFRLKKKGELFSAS
ncbi:MAG: prolipoprotein diacylglyceryl transferase [Bacteroidota bacterium]|nr:prolipoprotein diacylglyceryl transferase [Bacteroidota bacterium]